MPLALKAMIARFVSVSAPAGEAAASSSADYAIPSFIV